MTEAERHAFDVVSNPDRLKILALTTLGRCSIRNIAESLSMKEPSVRHHLSRLVELGIVIANDDVPKLYVCDQRGLQRIALDIRKPKPLAVHERAQRADSAKGEEILANFLQNGKLKAIPAKVKRKLPILRWLSQKFDVGTKYRETEINAILRHYHEDVALLRRELVDSRFLCRLDSTYWRNEDEAEILMRLRQFDL